MEGAADSCHYLGRLWEIRRSDRAAGTAAASRTKRAADLEILATVGGAADSGHYLGRLWEIRRSDRAVGPAAPACTKRAADPEILRTLMLVRIPTEYARKVQASN
ncbi:hypothetical protein V496_00414 [Pseudogymnoascus sp. VKM F-4515 (FW-2607)]|nr:hypothetical protein V496_00414 [Pseudogymnoascus sp. VKM F-4515 (FW-2607)]